MKNPGWIYAAVVAGTCFWWVFSEAARFNHNVRPTSDGVDGKGFESHTHMLELENNWRETVQDANVAAVAVGIRSSKEPKPCFEADGYKVRLENCSEIEDQIWNLNYNSSTGYETISPHLHPDRCLNYNSSDYVVLLEPCAVGDKQQWHVETNVYIWNLATGYVMQAISSSTILLTAPAGLLSQKWNVTYL